MTTYKIDVNEVENEAQGHWSEILSTLAPTVKEALASAPKHVACPIHGGSDGFRFFRNTQKSKAICICNTCGSFDGLHLLMRVNRWDFYTALRAVHNFLHPSTQKGIGSVFTGTVSQLGLNRQAKEKFPLFSVTLTLLDGSEKSFSGALVKQLCEEKQVKVGDKVTFVKTGEEERTNRQGQSYKRNLWQVSKEESDEDLPNGSCLVNATDTPLVAQEASVRRSKAIFAKWYNALPIKNDDDGVHVAKTYLASRHVMCEGLLADVRFVQEEPYFENGTSIGRFPALVSAVRNTDGHLVTLHKTYLTPDGKKLSGRPAKKIMLLPEGVSINGTAIRLGNVEDADIVCVTEGLETGLSVAKATGYPCLVALNAHCLEALQIPNGIKTVLIFADRDKSHTGQNAGYSLQARLQTEGIPSVVFLPGDKLIDIETTEKGVDWNDVLCQCGEEAFPIHKNLTY